LFEHVDNDELYEDFEYVHLVERFKDGNALIPLDVIAS
jgi:hypothetical protein